MNRPALIGLPPKTPLKHGDSFVVELREPDQRAAFVLRLGDRVLGLERAAHAHRVAVTRDVLDAMRRGRHAWKIIASGSLDSGSVVAAGEVELTK